MYQGKRKNKKWTIQEKNEIVLLYLDGHMGWTEILRTFSIPGNRMLQRWIEQYRKYGTCVDNRGKCTKLQNPNKGRQINIKHQLIRAYTPRQNGKVERSHRSDQESFYNHLKFKAYNELKKKMMAWNITYNNRPHSSLRNREGKRVWWSPLEKRADLLNLLEEKKEEFDKVRFLKKEKCKTIRQIYKVA